MLAVDSPSVKTRPSPPDYDSVTTPSPLMGEGWGEGEIRNPLQLCHLIEIANPRIEYGVAMTE